MKIRIPPATASIASEPDENGKLFAPSAARNSADLCDTVTAVAPVTGDALEIASGTGQHIVTFAAALPAIQWHPSEVDPLRLSSIEAYTRESGLTNLSKPFMLNATAAGWGDTVAPKDLILLTNLLHLISADEVTTLIKEAAFNLTTKGKLVLYGPFKRDGKLTSEGDASFDANIRASDPDIGYKDDRWVKSLAEQIGLALVRTQEMPANNLALIFQKP